MTPLLPPPGGQTRRQAAAAALIVGLTLLVYAPGIAAGFVGDDFMILHRLRQLAGPADALAFFGAEFFEYYRPLGFLAHALDYAVAGSDPRQYHATNILLHAVNTVLVLLLGRRLSPQSLAGPIAALLFALHASNHEAVMWVSARFDLLATTFALAAIWLVTRRDGSLAPSAVLFGLAILSKESAVALPLAAAGWVVFCLRSSTSRTVLRLAPWLAALAVYAFMRQMGGGIPAAGGASRLPKLAAFGGFLAAFVAMADGRWLAIRERLRQTRPAVAAAAGLLIAAVAAMAAFSNGAAGRLAAEKLAVAGFALFHLASPVVDVSDTPFYLNPSSTGYWAWGVLCLSVAVVIVLALWRRLVDDDRCWFLAALLVAALLPVSALTEGKRYLYLPSAATSLLAGVLVAEVRGRRLTLGLAAVAVVTAVSAVDVAAKIRDWKWAGAMTADAASLVDSALAPGCGEGHVVFLTSPVAIRGVYTHFYYETFELPRGCRPALFQVLVRVVRIDSAPDVRWDGPERIEITTERYRGNLVLSQDLRHFDRPLAGRAIDRFDTPLGSVEAEPIGADGERLTLTLAPSLQRQPPLFFYYSNGRIVPLAVRPAAVGGGLQPATQSAGPKAGGYGGQSSAARQFSR